MDRWTRLRVFLAVADAEGFAAAARSLGMSPPAVTRAIASLEEELGTLLLHRTTRKVRLTEVGARYAADVRRILDALADADAAASGDHAEPRGLLSITAPVLFGRMHVAPLVFAFQKQHPQVIGRLLLLDRVVDLIDEAIDVAVRIAALPDSSLHAVKVGEVRRVLCASPAYLRRRGRPRTPSALEEHETITTSDDGGAVEWRFADDRVRPSSRLLVNAPDVAIAAALAGRGIARVHSYQVAAQLADGTLELLLEDHAPPPVPVHVVYREGRRAAARVRSFVDFASAKLRRQLGQAARQVP